MKKIFILLLQIFILIAIPVAGLAQCSKPAPKTSLANSCPAVDPELEKLLEKIEKAGAQLKSLQAKMSFQQVQSLIDVKEIRHGRLYYQLTKDTVMFRIRFKDFQQIDLDDENPQPAIPLQMDYAFDGLWFTKRDYRNKNIQRWEISKTPRSREAFRLGKGPFPLPFAIRKADVLKEFFPALPPADPNNPTPETHLQLKPKKDSSFAEQYVQLELWISPKTTLPERLRYETTDAEITTVNFSDIKLNKKINSKEFILSPPGPGWTTETIPLAEEPQ